MCESKRAEFVDCGSRRPCDKAWCLATDLKCVKRGDCRPTPSAVWHVDRRLTVSRLLPGSGTLLLSCSFFTLKVSSSDVDGGRLGFWLSLSVQGRPRKLVSVGLSLLLRGTVALALKALLLLLLLLLFFPSAQREPSVVKAVGMWACFRAVSPPLGPSHRRSPDPCASNVNNPAFPGPGGEGRVSKSGATVSNTARFNRESAQSLRNFGPFESESPQVLFCFLWLYIWLLRGYFGRTLMKDFFVVLVVLFCYFKFGWCCPARPVDARQVRIDLSSFIPWLVWFSIRTSKFKYSRSNLDVVRSSLTFDLESLKMLHKSTTTKSSDYNFPILIIFAYSLICFFIFFQPHFVYVEEPLHFVNYCESSNTKLDLSVI